MKSFLKALLPVQITRGIRLIVKAVKYKYRFYKVYIDARRGKVDKIIVGAAETHQMGWHATNEQWLNITKREDWEKIFPCKGKIKCITSNLLYT